MTIYISNQLIQNYVYMCFSVTAVRSSKILLFVLERVVNQFEIDNPPNQLRCFQPKLNVSYNSFSPTFVSNYCPVFLTTWWKRARWRWKFTISINKFRL